jgi:hypothetical protein
MASPIRWLQTILYQTTCTLVSLVALAAQRTTTGHATFSLLSVQSRHQLVAVTPLLAMVVCVAPLIRLQLTESLA